MTEASIQHKRQCHIIGETGFDDDRRPVPVVWPEKLKKADAYRLQVQILVRFLSALLEAGETAEEIGRAVLFMGYECRNLPGAPADLASLASRMGVTKGRASQIVSKLNGENSGFAGVFAQIDDSD